jgi:hypothetical protein
MADEARITSGLSIRKGGLEYQSRPSSFLADVTGTKGPVPGAFTASLDGTDVDLSELDQPGLCRMMNLDDTNYVQVGIWEPDTSLFYPLMELLPGETFPLRLARDLGQQFEGTGTGTGITNATLRVKAFGAACVVIVEAFES